MTSTRSRQRRALAAGGVVLGIGSVLVAASWTDNVLGSSNFQSGSRFGIESSVDGGTVWGSNPMAGVNNKLVFTPTVDAVVPGSVSYASIRLRTEIGSAAAKVTLSGAQLSGDASLGGALVYRAVRLATVATPCAVAAFGPSSWVAGSGGAVPLTTGSIPDVFTLPAATSTAAGAATSVCFEISLPATPTNWSNPALPGKTSTPDWAFTGKS